MAIEVREVRPDEIPAVVRVHDDAFKGFFLTTLGDRFLEVYYRSVSRHKNGVLLGFYKERRLSGFCAATRLSRGFNSSLVRENWRAYAFVALRLLVGRPGAIVRLVKNFTKGNPGVKDDGAYGELLSIGVAKEAQGTGAGKNMLRALETRLRESGVDRLSLTTDYYDNEQAVGFYKSQGYEVMYDFVTYPERRMYRLIKRLK